MVESMKEKAASGFTLAAHSCAVCVCARENNEKNEKKRWKFFVSVEGFFSLFLLNHGIMVCCECDQGLEKKFNGKRKLLSPQFRIPVRKLSSIFSTSHFPPPFLYSLSAYTAEILLLLQHAHTHEKGILLPWILRSRKNFHLFYF